MVKELYTEPKKEEVLGTFIVFESQDLEKNSTGNLNRKRKEKKSNNKNNKVSKKDQLKINDIRVLFKRNVHAQRRDVEIVKSHNATEIEVINLDSE